MLKSHEVTETIQATHRLCWDNGISAKVEYLGDNISNFNFLNDNVNLFALNIQDVDNFFYNMREELTRKITLNSLEDIKNFNSFDKLFGIKSNMLFDMNCNILRTYMDVTVHVNLTSRQIERILDANEYIKSIFIITDYKESYNYSDDSNDRIYVEILKLKFASDEAMIKVLGTNDARKLEFIDRTKIANIITEALKMGS